MNNTSIIPDEILDDPAIRDADAQAVMDHYISGKYLDPAIIARVRARSEKITEETYQKYGELNIAVDLIREGHNEE